MTGFYPVFEKDGHEFVLPYSEFLAETEEDARKVGIGSILECVSYGMKYTFKNVDVNSGLDCMEGAIGEITIIVLPEGWDSK